MAAPKITRLEFVAYEHHIQDVGRDYNGFNSVYEKGSSLSTRSGILRIHTDAKLESIDANGCVVVPEGPGLGVELDWDWITSHRTRKRLAERSITEEGALELTREGTSSLWARPGSSCGRR